MSRAGFVVHRPRRESSEPVARYEYRVWFGAADPAVSRLQCRWTLVAAERRSDIYLLGPEPGRVLVKLRDGHRLEIKRRMHDVGTIQLWTLPVSTGFPLAAGHRATLGDALGIDGGLSPETGLSPAHLLSAFGAEGTGLISRTLRKSRLLFERGGCRAEICRVAAGGWTGLTVALEGTDLPEIALAIGDLGLGRFPNRSYGDILQRLSGLRRAGSRGLIYLQTHERRHS